MLSLKDLENLKPEHITVNELFGNSPKSVRFIRQLHDSLHAEDRKAFIDALRIAFMNGIRTVTDALMKEIPK